MRVLAWWGGQAVHKVAGRWAHNAWLATILLSSPSSLTANFAGYAGRSDLPDNLKSLFRPVSMMVPAFALIAEIVLLSEGFTQANKIAPKITTAYRLARQQLSKQDHYDFGLRAIIAVLVTAGKLRRNARGAHLSQEEVVLSALIDMNMPKLIAKDVPLFNGILDVLFADSDPPDVVLSQLEAAINNELDRAGLVRHDGLAQKIIYMWQVLFCDFFLIFDILVLNFF